MTLSPDWSHSGASEDADPLSAIEAVIGLARSGEISEGGALSRIRRLLREEEAAAEVYQKPLG